MVLRVDIEQLLAAATLAGEHGAELAARHLWADNRLEAAAPGWAGRSAAALTGRAELWRDQSRRLLTRFAAHTTGLHASACEFAALEQRSAAALSSPTAGANPAAAIR